MTDSDLKSLLETIPVTMTDRQIADFDLYIDELLKWNRIIHFTKYDSRGQIINNIIIPSLAFNTLILPGMRCADLGTGPGVPGLITAIAAPASLFTLIDSKPSCIEFLESLKNKMALENLQATSARSESAAHQEAEREIYDVAMSRSMAALPVTLEIASGFVRPGGVILITVPFEITEFLVSNETLEKIQIAFEAIHTPGQYRTSIGVFRKLGPLDPGYPRPWNTIKNSPLFPSS